MCKNSIFLVKKIAFLCVKIQFLYECQQETLIILFNIIELFYF